MAVHWRQIAFRAKWLTAIVGVAVFGGLVLFFSVPHVRRALPWSASNIKEYRTEGRWGANYDYYLKAKVPAGEWLPFTRRLDLKRWSHGDLSICWPTAGPPLWWTVIGSDAESFWRRDGCHLIAAKYQHGYVFVHATNY